MSKKETDIDLLEVDGEHDAANAKLVKYDLGQHELVVKERQEKVRFVFCLVFAAELSEVSMVDKALGVCDGCNPISKKKEDPTLEDLKIDRELIIRHIREAGFQTSMFYSTTKKQIICRIGATDERLLAEADLLQYGLQLDPFSLQHCLEKEVTKEFENPATGEMIKETRKPIYLGFNGYSSSDYKKLEVNGKTLSKAYKNIGGVMSHLTTGQIKRSFNNQTLSIEQVLMPFLYKQATPFEYIHVEYNPEWEEYFAANDEVQIYRTYNDGTVLRTADRVQLLISALERERTSQKGYRGAGMDLTKMQFDDRILASFPIQFSKGSKEAGDLTAEGLYDKWQRRICCGVWGPTFFVPWIMPLTDIRDYAGEKIAYYFAFLGFYSAWLVPASIVGFVFFAMQLSALNEVLGTYNFITGSAGVFEYNMSEFDDIVGDDKFKKFAVDVNGSSFLVGESPTEIPALPYYALFISLWGTFLLEFWKRHQNRLALQWGVSDYKRTAQIRPEFKPNYWAPSPVTGLPVPYRSNFVFGLKFSASITIILSAVVVTISTFAATYIFKVFMSSSTNLDPLVAPQIALVVNAVAIIVLGIVFKKMAGILTNWENHRTDVEYENNLIGKTFVFTFFNSYTTLIYFAFIRQGRDLPPNDQTQYCITQLEEFDKVGNYSDSELIKVDSCYGAVGYSLAIIFASQILVNNSMEIGIPLAKQFQKKYFSKKALEQKRKQFNDTTGINIAKGVNSALDQVTATVGIKGGDEEKANEPEDDTPVLKSPAEHQFELQPYETPFDDYLELALQFGYVTLFVSAFPLAPFLALLNNVVEAWVDASKVCLLSRRPSLPKAQDIGTWLTIFTILNYLSVLINSALLLFTSSNIIPIAEDEEEKRVWAFFAFIAAVISIKIVADYFIEDIPVDVTVQLERQEYYIRKVFFADPDEDDEDDTEGQVDLSKSYSSIISVPTDAFDVADRDPYMLELLSNMKSYIKLKYGDDLDKAFENMDLNKSEDIDLKELREVLSSTEIGIGEYMSSYELKLVMGALDRDNDGTFSREEFHKFVYEDFDV
mmetsp:Transcript_17332/g.22103  ORF Transcript_17332/g.22103 Transcript_17332/m.22103 type:complete len:1054 (+) Transcript_17332:100-3261(+)